MHVADSMPIVTRFFLELESFGIAIGEVVGSLEPVYSGIVIDIRAETAEPLESSECDPDPHAPFPPAR